MKGIVFGLHISCMTEYSKVLADMVEQSKRTNIVYNYFGSSIAIGDKEYEIERESFSKIAGTVLGTLKEMYGEYRTIPKSFNSETYENDLFQADVLALGGQGLLEFIVYNKQVM